MSPARRLPVPTFPPPTLTLMPQANLGLLSGRIGHVLGETK